MAAHYRRFFDRRCLLEQLEQRKGHFILFQGGRTIGFLGWVTAGRWEVIARSDRIAVPREEGWTHVLDSSSTKRFSLVKRFGKYHLRCSEKQTLLGIPLAGSFYKISTSDIPRLREWEPDLRQWLDEVEELMKT